MILSEKKLNTVQNDIESYKLLKESIVEFSIKEKYVKNIKDFDIMNN